MFKHLAAQLPGDLQFRLKRAYFRAQIMRSRFTSQEPEFALLKEWLSPGDVAIDVGANVGCFARRMAEVVGPGGSVFALEPMQESFRLLAANVGDCANVTPLKLAASDRGRDVYMDLPRFQSGLANYYQANISAQGTHRVRTIPLDFLDLDRVALIKIDAEGHELSVLQGAQKILERSHPRLIVEGSETTAAWLRERGYQIKRMEGSPNFVAENATRLEP
jgi:FkbM family methyltransferase